MVAVGDIFQVWRCARNEEHDMGMKVVSRRNDGQLHEQASPQVKPVCSEASRHKKGKNVTRECLLHTSSKSIFEKRPIPHSDVRGRKYDASGTF